MPHQRRRLMSLPGFTGELALYQTARHYRSTGSVNHGTGGAPIVPAVLAVVCDQWGDCWLSDMVSWGPLFGNTPVWQGDTAEEGIAGRIVDQGCYRKCKARETLWCRRHHPEKAALNTCLARIPSTCNGEC